MNPVRSEMTGAMIDSSSEQHRHECECRAVLAMQPRERRAEFIAGVAKKRGDVSALAIKRDVLLIHMLRLPASTLEDGPDPVDRFLSNLAAKEGYAFAESLRLRYQECLDALASNLSTTTP